MKRPVVLLLSLFMGILCLAGCGTGAYQEEMDFTYALPTSITSLDPQTCKLNAEKTVISFIFEGLCRLDSTGAAIPGVAAGWQANTEYTRFTFHLREGACWSTGEPVVAEDFVFGVRRSLKPDSKALGIESMFIIKNAREVNAGEAEVETLGVYAPDSHTVVFDLNVSYEDFPKLTAGARFMPCQQKFFEDTVGHYGMDCVYTLTNGPFTFATNYAWDPDISLQLARTNLHVAEEPVLPGTITLLLTDESVNLSDPVKALVEEEVDLLGLGEAQIEEAKENNCEIITLHDTVYGLLINTKDELLQHLSVREIYIDAIDRKEVISRMGEQYEEALGIMPRCVMWAGKPYQQSDQIMYAKQDKGVLNNIGPIISSLDLEELPSIKIICLDDEYSKHLANGIIVSWNQNLPNMFNLEPLDRESYFERLAAGDYQAALYSFSANGTTPLSVFSQFASTASPRLLEDEEYDSMLKSFSFTRDACQQLEQALLDAYIYYPIHYTRSYYGVNPKVKGIIVTADLGPDFTGAVKRDS